jgi:hypothetical protein
MVLGPLGCGGIATGLLTCSSLLLMRLPCRRPLRRGNVQESEGGAHCVRQPDRAAGHGTDQRQELRDGDCRGAEGGGLGWGAAAFLIWRRWQN